MFYLNTMARNISSVFTKPAPTFGDQVMSNLKAAPAQIVSGIIVTAGVAVVCGALEMGCEYVAGSNKKAVAAPATAAPVYNLK